MESSQPNRRYLRISNEVGFSGALFSGAFAGLAVDLTLYPLDTIKTRLQSEQGLLKSGGFRNIYAGIPSVLIGSAPGAALFFSSYEVTKHFLTPFCKTHAYAHMTAASVGEIMACLVRVPTEVLKQRGQAFPKRSLFYVYTQIRVHEGVTGFYRGYLSTVLREIPFSLIQFPLWEHFKDVWSKAQGYPVVPLQGAFCGSIAGVLASGITTPLDVAKTRIMLAERVHGHARGNVHSVLSDVWKVSGIRGLFAGVFPRMIWMGLGGFVFFGAYEYAKKIFIRSFVLDQETVDMSGENIFFFRQRLWKLWDQKMYDFFFKNHYKTFEESFELTRKTEERRKDFLERREKARAKFREEISQPDPKI